MSWEKTETTLEPIPTLLSSFLLYFSLSILHQVGTQKGTYEASKPPWSGLNAAGTQWMAWWFKEKLIFTAASIFRHSVVAAKFLNLVSQRLILPNGFFFSFLFEMTAFRESLAFPQTTAILGLLFSTAWKLEEEQLLGHSV